MSPQQLIFAMIVLAPLCAAHIGGLQSSQDLSPRIYCGRTLARVIAALCSDDEDIEKRSEFGTMYGALIPPYYKEQDTHIGWPWMSSAKARVLGSNRGKRYTSGGVADECCDKPCRISELTKYC